MHWLTPDQNSQWGVVSAENPSRCFRFPALSEHCQDPSPFFIASEIGREDGDVTCPWSQVNEWQSQG